MGDDKLYYRVVMKTLEPTLSEATKSLHSTFAANYMPDTLGVPEACDEVNNASREVIRAMARDNGGACWLARVNQYHDEPVMYEFSLDNGDVALNFCCSFALP